MTIVTVIGGNCSTRKHGVRPDWYGRVVQEWGVTAPSAVSTLAPAVLEQQPRRNFNARRSRQDHHHGEEKADKPLEEVLARLRAVDVATSAHYHKAVQACKPRREWRVALDLLREMINRGVVPLVYTWGVVMDLCASAKRLDQAVAVADLMTRSGVEMNKVRKQVRRKALCTRFN